MCCDTSWLFLLADGLIMFQGVMFYNAGFIFEVPQRGTHIGNISYSACLHRRSYIIVGYISFSFVPHLLFSLIYAYCNFLRVFLLSSLKASLLQGSSWMTHNCYYHWYALCLFTLQPIF